MFEHAKAAPPDTNVIADQETRIIPSDLILPPPALLWEWLSYIYQTTGEWWRPPTAGNTFRPAQEPKTAPVVRVKDYQGFSRSFQPATFPAKKSKTPSGKSLSGKTGFDYRASRYYEEAGRLLAESSSIHISDENYTECRLVLALIIAWSRFSLFENLPINGFGWMALSFGKGASELKMRASAFKSCLEALEAAGMLQLVNLSEGFVSSATLAELHRRRVNLSGEAASLFNSHFFQKNTTLYILTGSTGPDLPGFNPFSERLSEAGKTLEPISNIKINPASLSGSFQKASCKNESNNENEEVSFFEAENEVKALSQAPEIKRGSTDNKLEMVFESLSSQQRSIYRFITEEARFEGFCRLEDRRETLDDWEALKFAGSGRYTLEQVITRFQQVKAVWESKEKCHNPLALLHWVLTNDVDPRRGKVKTPGATVSSKPAISHHPIKRSYDAPKGRPQLSYQKRMFTPKEMALPAETGEALPAPESLKIYEPLAELKDPGQLWKVIYEDLTGRFQLSSTKLTLLQDSSLRFADGNPGQVEVVLRSILEERQLDSSTRHLIKLALRQRLGPGLEVTFISK